MVKNHFLSLVGVKFDRNEKFQKTKVIYFMVGTSSFMGESKIQNLYFIIPPYLCGFKVICLSLTFIYVQRNPKQRQSGGWNFQKLIDLRIYHEEGVG